MDRERTQKIHKLFKKIKYCMKKIYSSMPINLIFRSSRQLIAADFYDFYWNWKLYANLIVVVDSRSNVPERKVQLVIFFLCFKSLWHLFLHRGASSLALIATFAPLFPSNRFDVIILNFLYLQSWNNSIEWSSSF